VQRRAITVTRHYNSAVNLQCLKAATIATKPVRATAG
jgi:hypothetical protein